ncbi:MAG: hypothetical protein KDB52_01535 [Solirubrobacterales bacterium]|nr:hypothetical protein [Solirubrobacterales bacterium]
MPDQNAGLPEPQGGVPERCTGCGKPMAEDQRYCLNCGKRRGKARVEFENYLPEAGGEGAGTPPPTQGVVRPVEPEDPYDRPEREVTPLMAAVGLCAVAMILLVGVLIGRSGGGEGSSGTPQFVASTGLPPTSTSSTSTTSTSTTITTDWPEGQEGFTIELATLSKEGADAASVEAAKTDLVAQGASEVGVLDSDLYGSLPTGNYVLYSGVYSTRAEADTALSSLSTSFPDAQVIEVAADASASGAGTPKTTNDEPEDDGTDTTLIDGSNADNQGTVQASKEDLEALENATGEEYEKIQEKLPPTIATPGEPPPKDNKAPGGGGQATTIG